MRARVVRAGLDVRAVEYRRVGIPTANAPVVARLRVYPFKSLDGVDVTVSAVERAGGLAHDREFALMDGDGAFVNAKREPRVHALRAAYDLARGTATFFSERLRRSTTFAFEDSLASLERFFGDHFEREIVVVRDRANGFPDDTLASGPTLVASATLAEVASWFEGISLDSIRRRLRANVEIDDVPAFWEDGLFGRAGEAPRFAIGRTEFEGVEPCARCIVPSRDPESGAPLERFAKIVAQRRAARLPAWAERSRFDHFYRLTTTTRTLGPGGRIELGDRVVIAREARA